MRFPLYLFSVMALICPAVVSADRPDQPPGMRGEQQKITQEARRIDQAIQRGDVDAFKRLVPENWTLINVQGQLETREQMAEAIRTGRMKFQSIQRQTDQVRIVGDAAVETGILGLEGQAEGQNISGQFAFTNVWVRQRGQQWQPLSSQLTPVTGEPARLAVDIPAPADPQAVQADLQRLGGRWQLVAAITDGRPAPIEVVQRTVLITEGQEFRFPDEARTGTAPAGRFTINPQATPRQVDSVATAGPAQGQTSRGIYQINGDSQVIFCFAQPGAARPTDFSAPAGSGRTLQVFNRAGDGQQQQR
jgi:uncharacterized protein (TIGR03067 family)